MINWFFPGVSLTKKYDMVVFDMDGTLTTQPSCWRVLNEYFGVEQKALEKKWLLVKQGNYAEFVSQVIRLWNKPAYSEVEKALEGYELVENAQKTVDELKKRGYLLAVVSCGVKPLVDAVAKHLGIEETYSNEFVVEEEGVVGANIRVHLFDKTRVLEKISQKHKIPLKRFVSVSDSKYDKDMMENTGLGIAFNPVDEEIRKAADVVVEGKDLSKILDYL